jgi:ethanolamine ammonia-lyase small subunit
MNNDAEISENSDDLIERALAATPARLLVGRAGSSYRTETALKLRADHAAARDAVYAELDLVRNFGQARIDRFQLFETHTRASTKAEHLMRPDLGRRLADEARTQIVERCPANVDLQVVIGDGLSATAVATQAPRLLDLLGEAACALNWRFGQPFTVRYCRVGVLNDVGELLNPLVAVLLIGERPGLATAESLSAYLAFRPQPGHSDANRNLVSNIHARGIDTEQAANRIILLAATMMRLEKSGVDVKEELISGIRAGDAASWIE